MKKLLCAIVLFAAAVLCMGGGALAAGSAEVAIQADVVSEGEQAWNVSCTLSSDTKVTNGKIRITYDGSQLALVSSDTGSLLSGATSSINDPLSGNKEEGEILVVFASASELGPEGVVLNMVFALQDGVSAGDEITINVSTEELVDNEEAVTPSDMALTLVVGETVTNVPSATSGTTGGTTASAADSGTSGSSDEGASSSDGTSGEIVSSDEEDGSDEDTLDSSDSSVSGETAAEDSSSENNAAKTGDETNIVGPVVVIIIVVIVIICVCVWLRQRRKKEEKDGQNNKDENNAAQ